MTFYSAQSPVQSDQLDIEKMDSAANNSRQSGEPENQ